MFVEHCNPFQGGRYSRAAPPCRSVTLLLASLCLRAEPRSVSALRVVIVAACCLRLAFHSLRRVRESERWAVCSVTE
jgi:hypothetical protein